MKCRKSMFGALALLASSCAIGSMLFFSSSLTETVIKEMERMRKLSTFHHYYMKYSTAPGLIGFPMDIFKDAWNFPPADLDVPFVWGPPQCQSLSVLRIMTKCFALLPPGHLGFDSISKEGLDKLTEEEDLFFSFFGKDLGFHYFFSPNLYDAAELLSSELLQLESGGKLILVSRHPNHRLKAIYEGLVEDNHHSVMNKTFMDYLASDYVADNWITRNLVNNHAYTLTDEDYQKAIQIVRKKAIVIISDTPELKLQSIMNLKKYFNWSLHENAPENCVEEMLKLDVNESVVFNESDDEWGVASKINNYDIFLHGHLNATFTFQMDELAKEWPFNSGSINENE